MIAISHQQYRSIVDLWLKLGYRLNSNEGSDFNDRVLRAYNSQALYERLAAHYTVVVSTLLGNMQTKILACTIEEFIDHDWRELNETQLLLQKARVIDVLFLDVSRTPSMIEVNGSTPHGLRSLESVLNNEKIQPDVRSIVVRDANGSPLLTINPN